MTDFDESFVLLWSHNQDALHIEPLALMLESNRKACALNAGGDYRVLAVGTNDKMRAAADAVRPTLMRRTTPPTETPE